MGTTENAPREGSHWCIPRVVPSPGGPFEPSSLRTVGVANLASESQDALYYGWDIILLKAQENISNMTCSSSSS